MHFILKKLQSLFSEGTWDTDLDEFTPMNVEYEKEKDVVVIVTGAV